MQTQVSAPRLLVFIQTTMFVWSLLSAGIGIHVGMLCLTVQVGGEPGEGKAILADPLYPVHTCYLWISCSRMPALQCTINTFGHSSSITNTSSLRALLPCTKITPGSLAVEVRLGPECNWDPPEDVPGGIRGQARACLQVDACWHVGAHGVVVVAVGQLLGTPAKVVVGASSGLVGTVIVLWAGQRILCGAIAVLHHVIKEAAVLVLDITKEYGSFIGVDKGKAHTSTGSFPKAPMFVNDGLGVGTAANVHVTGKNTGEVLLGDPTRRFTCEAEGWHDVRCRGPAKSFWPRLSIQNMKNLPRLSQGWCTMPSKIARFHGLHRTVGTRSSQVVLQSKSGGGWHAPLIER